MSFYEGLPYTQENSTIKIHCSEIKEAVVVKAEIEEGVSKLFEIKITIQSKDIVEMQQLIGKQACLELLEDRFFSGIISNASLQNVAVNESDKLRAFNIICITVVPTVFPLTIMTKHRIFQDKSAIDIIDQILKENGITNIKKSLTSAGKTKRVFCTQYKETDWHFISRLMEEEGIYYYFVHEKNKDTLVLADDNTSSASKIKVDLIPRRYMTDDIYVMSDIFNINSYETLGIKSTLPISFNEDKFAPVLGKAENTSSSGNVGLIETYEVTFLENQSGNSFAELMLQRENCQSKFITAECYCPYVASGYNVSIKDSIIPYENGNFFVTEASHTVVQITEKGSYPSYKGHFKAIPDSVKFKPLPIHFKQRIHGTQTAKVTGPDGEEIYTDAQGRIKVRFYWDTLSEENEKSSCWIRVSQVWADKGFGGFVIPRIGSEVVVTFINGDPDSPIITGVVYNGVNNHPEKYADKKFISTFRTNSSEEAGGFNELRFDDTKDQEEIYCHAAKDALTVVEHDLYVRLLSKDDKKVQYSTFVKKGDHLTTIEEGDMTIILDKGNQSIVLKKGNQEISLNDGNMAITVKGDISIQAENISINANKDITVEAKGKLSVNTKDDTSFQTDKNFVIESKMDIKIVAKMNFKVEAKMNVNMQAGMNIEAEAKLGMTLKGLNINTEAKVGMTHKSNVTMKLESAVMVAVQASAMLKLEGSAMLSASGGLIKLN